MMRPRWRVSWTPRRTRRRRAEASYPMPDARCRRSGIGHRLSVIGLLPHRVLQAHPCSESRNLPRLHSHGAAGEYAVDIASLVVSSVERAEPGDRHLSAALDLLRDDSVLRIENRVDYTLHVGWPKLRLSSQRFQHFRLVHTGSIERGLWRASGG